MRAMIPTAHRALSETELDPLHSSTSMDDVELLAHDPQEAVGADQPDELDLSLPRQPFRDLEVLRWSSRHEAEARRDLVGRGALERGVAVVGVVEGLEAAQAVEEMTEPAEALAAEEALVEGVVRVLHRPLAPRLGEG